MKENKLQQFLDHFPVASFVFAVYAVAGGVALVLGSLDNGQYTESLKDVGIACGVIGGARALSRYSG